MSERITYRALAMRVIATAVYNDDIGDWAAYIDAVPGQNHEHEFMEVAAHGEKLPQKVAAELFPQIATAYRWRP